MVQFVDMFLARKGQKKVTGVRFWDRSNKDHNIVEMFRININLLKF